jgi:translocator assembly and maintenance protein 41
MNQLYQQVLQRFPHKHIKFAFAYGSGVFEQLENSTKKNARPATANMIDFVFVVDDSIKFHDENLRMNASHYSFLRNLGPYYLSRIERDFGAACYYNTLVNLKLDGNERCLMKYGVISEESLIKVGCALNLVVVKWRYFNSYSEEI